MFTHQNMKNNKEILAVLKHTLRHHIEMPVRSKLKFGFDIPYLTDLEFRMISYIVSSDELRPKMFKSKKQGVFSDLSSLLIPKSYAQYEHIFKTKQLYNEYKRRLIAKGLLHEVSEGFVLNHSMIPFEQGYVMKHLISLARMPKPPGY
jgi:hypothetical protein